MNDKASNHLQPVDNNDNVMIDAYQADTKLNGMRQMTLGKNCELLNDEVEMEDDESATFANSGQGYNFSDCKQFSIDDHGTAFGRSTAELSPSSLPVSPLNTLSVASQNAPLLNVFQRMKMAQLSQAKKSTEGMCIGGEDERYQQMK